MPAIQGVRLVRARSSRIQADPMKAQAVANARKRIGEWVDAEPSLRPMGLAALRLRAGLSQAELAERLKTSQPNIARMEKSPGNPTLDTVKGWARALDIEVAAVIAAIDSVEGASASEAG